MPWFKKNKNVENIPVEDGNLAHLKWLKEEKARKEEYQKLHKEGREKFYELFDEVVSTSTQTILAFHKNFKPPSSKIIDFGKEATLKIIHSDGDLDQYHRAQLFKERVDKYGQVVTTNMISDFRIKMRDFDLFIEHHPITQQRLSLTPEITEKMFEVSKKIDLDDTHLYFIFDNVLRGSVSNITDSKLIQAARDMFNCKFSVPEKVTDNYSKFIQKNNSDMPNSMVLDIPNHLRFGDFIAIREGADPIILAELTDNMYIFVDHMRTIPKPTSFLV